MPRNGGGGGRTLGPQGTLLGNQGNRTRQQGPQAQPDPPDLCFARFPAPRNGGG